MPAAALADSSAQLAVEQRRVRAEFVFMMGGEFAQSATGEFGEELDETAKPRAKAISPRDAWRIAVGPCSLPRCAT